MRHTVSRTDLRRRWAKAERNGCPDSVADFEIEFEIDFAFWIGIRTFN